MVRFSVAVTALLFAAGSADASGVRGKDTEDARELRTSVRYPVVMLLEYFNLTACVSICVHVAGVTECTVMIE
jgi:putative N-acetylmannosamine-6-phosphate epimerase